MTRRFLLPANCTRAALAALLLAVALTLAGCAGTATDRESASVERPPEVTQQQDTQQQDTQQQDTQQATEPDRAPAGEEAVGDEYEELLRSASETATPDPENLQGAPEFKDWNDPSIGNDVPNTAQFFNTGGSAGAIPAVKPFNFGRDPGGPEDKTMYVTVPRIGLEDVKVINSTSDEALVESTVHVPATGFPWQEGANTYIAGHRIGYPGTGSHLVFYDLDKLVEGDEILVRDSAGNEYGYRVFNTLVTDPFDVEVMNPIEGREIVTLQTCTLPDYSKRLVVQGELVDKNA